MEPSGAGDYPPIFHRQDVEVSVRMGQAVDCLGGRGRMGEHSVSIGPDTLGRDRSFTLPTVEQRLRGIVDQVLHATEGAGNKAAARDRPFDLITENRLAELAVIGSGGGERILHELDVGLFFFRLGHVRFSWQLGE